MYKQWRKQRTWLPLASPLHLREGHKQNFPVPQAASSPATPGTSFPADPLSVPLPLPTPAGAGSLTGGARARAEGKMQRCIQNKSLHEQ